ncbi:papain-like cysteine protease family protein [Comamonas sp. JC664]|uniref:papain-like cysteine protease family protein n=1 Tax=Comamonas sp. JC664 TaxID=2801917 RepID=UPI00174DF51E|nr:papain-like cysteine protease family protein [Comamonas sp. JC664]MBL0698242.1 hypothetical protein [Comamonas sp. JC664]GHG89155.1 hypothetical protein GCM10012319_48300 [Comamonas sp. KCTC 72670]
MRVNLFQSIARLAETRPQQPVEPAKPAQAQAPQQPQPAVPEVVAQYFTDSFEPAAGDSDVVKQTKDANCGAAVATMLSPTAGKDAVSASQKMDSLESRFTDGGGTTPAELAKMLAHENLEVKKGTSNFDMPSVDEALSRGQQVVVQLDTNRLATGQDTKVAGGSHWVVVDGKDDQGNYQVKDTNNGSKYSVSGQQIADAVGSAWELHKGGGMLVVGTPQVAMDESTLVEKANLHTSVLGDTDGGGSRARTSFGRESS